MSISLIQIFSCYAYITLCILSCILATRQVINVFRIKWVDLLDIHQAELQLVVTQSYCERKVKVTVRLTVSQSVSLGVEPHQIFIAVWQLRSSFYGAPSLLYMLLAPASAVILGSEYLRTRDHIYFTVSDLRLPFSSSPTILRVTVEVFDPASTRVCLADSLSVCYLR
jgi:hypothetical protein